MLAVINPRIRPAVYGGGNPFQIVLSHCYNIAKAIAIFSRRRFSSKHFSNLIFEIAIFLANGRLGPGGPFWSRLFVVLTSLPPSAAIAAGSTSPSWTKSDYNNISSAAAPVRPARPRRLMRTWWHEDKLAWIQMTISGSDQLCHRTSCASLDVRSCVRCSLRTFRQPKNDDSTLLHEMPPR